MRGAALTSHRFTTHDGNHVITGAGQAELETHKPLLALQREYKPKNNETLFTALLFVDRMRALRAPLQSIAL